MKVNVYVTLKNGVLDPQGKAIHHALEGLGFAGVNDVRAGKLIELDVADGIGDAELEEMCSKLLANTVIENFRIERDGGGGMKSAVIVFPGSNCDRDLAEALRLVTGRAPAMVWHREKRTARRARPDRHPRRLFLWRLSPLGRDGGAIAGDARGEGEAAERGVLVLGVCNGFQVLTEARLLPGALMRNAGIRFVCRDVPLRVENSQSAFTARYDAGEEIVVPVAHHDGNYQADERRSTGSRARAGSPSAMPTRSTARRAASPASSTRPATCSA